MFENHSGLASQFLSWILIQYHGMHQLYKLHYKNARRQSVATMLLRD